MTNLETNTNNPRRQGDMAFEGPIGEEYDLLRLVCPAAGDMSRQVGDFVKHWKAEACPPVAPRQLVEIGCGTGITTLELLSADGNQIITGVDSAPVMLDQAKKHLEPWMRRGQVRLIESDAQAFLASLPGDSVDIVASGYAFHNFLKDYRRDVIAEVFRVLKPGGVFVNGDRYALDDTLEHLNAIQQEAKHFFAVFSQLGRYDLLEQWIVHLFSDESPDHVMPLMQSVESYRQMGFTAVTVHGRYRNNAVVSAEKPEL